MFLSIYQSELAIANKGGTAYPRPFYRMEVFLYSKSHLYTLKSLRKKSTF